MVAANNIMEGDYVAELKGVVTPLHFTFKKEDMKYLFYFKKVNHVLDCRKFSSAAREIEPNVNFNVIPLQMSHDGKYKMVYVAIKNIPKGSKIFRPPNDNFVVGRVTEVSIILKSKVYFSIVKNDFYSYIYIFL